jgi:hypothetical protein
MKPFDPLRTLRCLTGHGVRFVVIGGLAGRLWGSPSITNDLDICHDATPDNLVRLSAALTELGARLRGVEDDLPWRPDPDMLAAADSFTLVTDAGNLDLLTLPAGTSGYEDVRLAAGDMDVGGVNVLVADVEDLIRMKRAAGRPKDLIEIEILGAVLEERDS